MKKTAIILLFLSITLVLASCGGEEQSGGAEGKKKDGNVDVYTTVYPLQFFAEEIGGDTVNVQSILPPGSDAHTYEPTTKEMVKMAGADLFIYNGAGLEGYAEKISDSIEPEGVTILEAASNINLDEPIHDHLQADSHAKEEDGTDKDNKHNHEEDQTPDHDGHNHGDTNPHVWLDPIRSAQMAENIKDKLVLLNPEKEEMYQQNYNQLENKLMELDQTFHERIESKAKRKLIVSHAAYGYWEEAYGIEQIAVAGLSPTNEPSQKDLEEIIHVAEENDLNYVVFEQNVTTKVSKVIQKEIGAESLQFHNLSVLSQKDINNGEDYFSLMNENLDALSTALSN
ncbi:metal ABC transporter solute-binding protein, Zn/Mn family [Halobacillus litoralis]|uniref:metal ABC transporter solute-binding protein, Zn/Mn family n=1 Tax=Halobacillus litoralis TaxID=45668 RepID=UPI001CFD3740|nr:zinc ABC transporter substrate-binding protein [Halobacillus litoralis]